MSPRGAAVQLTTLNCGSNMPNFQARMLSAMGSVHGSIRKPRITLRARNGRSSKKASEVPRMALTMPEPNVKMKEFSSAR